MSRFIALACTLACALAAYALPTLTGPSGLVVLPDALRPSAPIMGAATVLDGPGDRAIVLRAVANLGLAEVGALYQLDDVDLQGVNAKLSLQLPLPGIATALGGVLLDADAVETRALYLAATFTPGPLDVTLGATWTEIETPAGSADAVRPYVGVRLGLLDGLAVVAEYQAKSDDFLEADPITSLMLVRDQGPFALTIGMTNALGLLGREDHELFLGVVVPGGR